MDVCGLLSVVPPDEGTRVAEDRRGALEARVVDRALLVVVAFDVIEALALAVVWSLSLLGATARGSDSGEMISYTSKSVVKFYRLRLQLVPKVLQHVFCFQLGLYCSCHPAQASKEL